MVSTVTAANCTFNNIAGDLYNIHTHADLPSPCPSSLNDAPIDLLTTRFTGRTEELQRIGQILDVAHNNVPTRCAIHGMHGIGKSQLALKFARLSFDRGRYSHIFWISATTIEKLNQGFAKVLLLVRHPDRRAEEQSVVLTAAQRWLEESDMGINWLLIFDNVRAETLGFLQEHLPRINQRGSILFTTRAETVATRVTGTGGQQHEVFELRLPCISDAGQLLLQHLRNPETVDTKKAENIAECVGCLPLAMVQAASFMTHSFTTLDNMIALYQSEHKIQILQWENDLSSYEEKSVAATFSSHLEELDRAFPDASNLLKTLSFFDPEGIPLNILVQGIEVFSNSPLPSEFAPPIPAPSRPRSLSSLSGLFKQTWAKLRKRTGGSTQNQLNEVNHTVFVSPELESLIALIRSPVKLPVAVQRLQNLRLINIHSEYGTSVLRMHDLVQFMVQAMIGTMDQQLKWFHFATALICHAFQQIEDPEMNQCWAQCETLIPHIQALNNWDERNRYGKTDLMATNSRVAMYFESRGRCAEAEALCQSALAGLEKHFGTAGHLDVLQAMHNLAYTYWSQARLREAEDMYQRTLGAAEKVLGVKHTLTLRTMSRLALVYWSQGRYSAAEDFFARASEGMKTHLGPNNRYTLRTTAGLAMVYWSQGRYNESEKLYRLVLASTETYLGFEHSTTLEAVELLALACLSLGQGGEAEKLLLRAISAREKHFGADHPRTLWQVQHLGAVYRTLGRYPEAEKLCKHALEGMEKRIGTDHTHTLWTMQNLAAIYLVQGHYSEAEELYVRATTKAEKVFGPGYPYLLMVQRDLALLYWLQGRYGEAETLSVQTLTRQKRHPGPEHPHTLQTMQSLALIHLSQRRYSEAEELSKLALTSQEKQLGVEHPETLETVQTLAKVYYSQQRYDEAGNLCSRAFAGREKQLGIEHPDTLETMRNLSLVYQAQGMHNKAEALSKQALTGMKKCIGAQHPNTLLTMHSLATAFHAQGRYGEAEALLDEARAGLETQFGSQHPYVLQTAEALINLYRAQGRDEEVEHKTRQRLTVKSTLDSESDVEICMPPNRHNL